MDFDYDSYYSDYYESEEEDEEISPVTFQQTVELCLKPSLHSLSPLSYVIFWCLIYRFSSSFIKDATLLSVISLLTGLLSLHSLFSSNAYYVGFLVLVNYVFLFTFTYLQYHRNRGLFLLLVSLVFLCVGELWVVDAKEWDLIRGSQMIVVMKSVSLAFDLDIGKERNIPNLACYAGYVLCPSSCVFGPWVSYSDYQSHSRGKWTWKGGQRIVVKFLLALSFFTVSSCWADYVIPNRTWKWFIAYRDALSFRTSHYFISFFSEAILLMSGYSNPEFNAVSKPLYVEFPRSIVNVVIYWNIPMHNWLKVYVFNTSKKFGSFFAILFTYIVSSLLHGLNFRISAVLLSLGLYSYVEVMLRKKLATAFNACILAKDCKAECSHKYKKYHPGVVATNMFMLLLTVSHLAYLGTVFEAVPEDGERPTWRHTINKWGSLNYLSHYLAFFTYVLYFCIR